MSVTERVAARVRKDFRAEEAGQALQELATTETGNQDIERVHAAVVLAAAGDLGRLRQQIRLSQTDWRDALMGTGLEHFDWPAVLDREFGPVG